MENDVRYRIRQALEDARSIGDKFRKLVTAVKLPNGAVEIAVNDEYIEEKLEYILKAYDDEMGLKTNTDIVMLDVIII